MRKIISSVTFFLLLISFALALDSTDKKVSETLKDYIVSKYSQYSRDEVKISFKYAESTFDKLKSMGSDIKIEVLDGYPEFKPLGSVVFPLKVTGGQEEEKIFLRAKVEVLKKVAAAAKFIKKGKIVESGDLKVEERDVALLPNKYFTDLGAIISKESKLSIPANSTIFSWMVGDQPLIRRGSTVTVLVTGPGLAVKTKGEAQEDGYLNDEIKVKRIDSKKIILARVISPAEVEVKIE